jgi:drug/metabolite transporter (DMT)-like permease
MQSLTGAAYGLGAAALFGASAPFAKLLLADARPVMLAALLYLGAAAALTIARLVRSRADAPGREARLRGSDYAILGAVAALGGIAGPILMLWGLDRVSALSGALLLNLEAPFTILIAITLFGEYLGLREVIAAALMIGGAALLGIVPGPASAHLAGIGALAGACLCWGIDNNLSQRLSLRDPVAIVQVKTAAAGACMLIAALAMSEPLPPAPALIGALVLGSISYGLSLVLDVRALRQLGAAREAAYFATAPFIGALLAVPLFGRLPGAAQGGAAALMAAGVATLLREHHSHPHTHHAIEHDHLHFHDQHHQHRHDGPVTEPHAHPHRHEPVTHAHPHVSDLHHRHRHA